MTPEDVVKTEEAVAGLETLLNSFADSASRIKQRMIADGWTPEQAEQFVVLTTAPMVGIVASRVALGPQHEPGDIRLVPMDQPKAHIASPALVAAFVGLVIVVIAIFLSEIAT
jgi:hypothetical protein